MSILPYERSSCFWQRIAYLYRRLAAAWSRSRPTTTAPPRSSATRYVQLHALRARSRATQHRLAGGATLGAETSIDKVLVATAEQATYDAVRRLLPGVVEIGRQPRTARRGASSTCTRGRRRSTAAPPRCSATSSPAVCSTSGADELMDAGRAGAAARRPSATRIAGATRSGPQPSTPSSTELGWLEMLDAEPRDAIDDRVHRARARRTRPRSVLDDVVASALGVEPRADLAVLLPPFAAWDPPGPSRRRAPVRGRARAPPRVDHRERAARRRHARQRSASRSPCRSRPSTCSPVHGDRSRRGLPHRARRRTDGASTRRSTQPRGTRPSRSAGARVAHQIAGACRTMLELAAAHALERVQFGRPIARFQAVRHRLADALVAIEALDGRAGRGGGRAEPDHRRARQGDRRPHRPHRRRPLPAGARRHRLHHRPPVPPVPEAHDGARRHVRIGRRDRRRPRPRLLAHRRVPTLIEL